MIKIFYLLTGGALGTLFRYLISGLSHKYLEGMFPWGTLMVNITGAFLIGLSWGFFEMRDIPPHIRMFLFIGFLGGYTTFSTYALETMNLVRNGDIKTAMISILANNVLALLLVFGGYFLARYAITLFK